MKIQIRNTNNSDLNIINDLQHKCFTNTDVWYETILKNYLTTGLILELIKDNKKKPVGVLLQGYIQPCSTGILGLSGDVFEPVNDYGHHFLKTNEQYNNIHGITMLCIHPKYQKKGLATKLISYYHEINKNKLLCLNTRASNKNAISLYKKLGYNHIGNIKNKYFLPTEDSVFMITNK
jgi:ribosomal protein S18 acetylase RimI-like enzyme